MDENTINNIKNMVDNGNIQDAISQISPEMIQNFSKMFSNMNSGSSGNQQNPVNLQNQENSKESVGAGNFTNAGASNQNSNTTNTSNTNTNTTNKDSGFDFSNIDINMLSKMSSIMGKMNNSKDDPRKNLLNSLRPYLRDNKKGKLDNYMNLLNVTQIAELMKNTDKENENNV